MITKMDDTKTHDFTIDDTTFSVLPFKWNQEGNWISFVAEIFGIELDDVTEIKPKPQQISEAMTREINALLAGRIVCIKDATSSITEKDSILKFIAATSMTHIMGIGAKIHKLSKFKKAEAGN